MELDSARALKRRSQVITVQYSKLLEMALHRFILDLVLTS